MQPAPERIQEELRRTFALPHAGQIARDLHSTGLLFAVFAEMKPMAENPASPLSKLTVLEHTFRALDALERILAEPEKSFGRYGARVLEFMQIHQDAPRLRLALLLHDIGKPLTQAETEGRLTFYGHDQVGSALAGKLLEKLRFPADDVRWIQTVIRGHLRIGFYSDETVMNPRKIYKYFKEYGEAGIALMAHSLADLRGYDFDFEANPWGLYQPEVVFALLHAYFEKNKLVVSPPKLLNGRDLIALGYPPGPAFAHVLTGIEEAQVDGRVKTRGDALELARTLFEEVGAKL
jgi:putative nucleotidyltransferase with HDIG domain